MGILGKRYLRDEDLFEDNNFDLKKKRKWIKDIKLKKCPFCKNKVKLKIKNINEVKVLCNCSRLKITFDIKTKKRLKKSIKNWNKR